MFGEFLVQGVQIILAEKIILTHIELQLLLLFIVPSKLTLEVIISIKRSDRTVSFAATHLATQRCHIIGISCN